MSRRVSREEFANMERMLIEYSKGYEALYTITYNNTVKVDELDRQIAELTQQIAELVQQKTNQLIGLGDK